MGPPGPRSTRAPARPDTERARSALADFARAGGDASDPATRDALATLAERTPALLPLAISDRSLLPDVLARPLARGDDAQTIDRTFAEARLEDDPDALARALRRARHRGLTRIALREALGLADVATTSREMAWLASAAIDAALESVLRAHIGKHGEPVDGTGTRVPLVVLGMGKLGGNELNLGSDVDLCFFYATDDAEVRGSELTVHELYGRVAQRTSSALADVTEDGFCFRVDLRLRPEGSRGPLVNSLASAERYYESFGRTWERAAMLRAAPVAGDRAFGRELLAALRPFVYRRKVDPGVAREMNELLRKTRRESKVAEDDVKLGRGGIREAEFFVQSLQLIWGGQHPSLQVPGTLDALARLSALGLVSSKEAESLEAAWTLLRRVEHRIHAWAGYQTHVLPRGGEELDRFARSLGATDGPTLLAEVRVMRDHVAQLLDGIVEHAAGTDEELETLAALVASGAPASEIAKVASAALGVVDAEEASQHLVRLGRRATSPLGPVSFEREPAHAVTLLREAREAADVDSALRHLADFFGRLAGPWAYERWLFERPLVFRRLVALFGASNTLGAALVGHPETLDAVLARAEPIDEGEIRRAHLVLKEDDDVETFVGALRRLKRETTLEIGLAHADGTLDLAAVSARLSALAEAQIAVCVSRALAETWTSLLGTKPDDPLRGLLVVGLGKLGGQELGFGSDLDLMFLYDGDETLTHAGREVTSAELYTRAAQRAMRLLSQPDAEGNGYATDARLRPSGKHGLLVVSLSAFDRYHETGAAPWERQALTRARPVAGDPKLAEIARARFAHLAFEVGAMESAELAGMRRRIETELAGEKPGTYHPKLGHGGLVDVEFVVQWLQMQHGKDLTVRSPRTMDALAALEAKGHLGSADAEILTQGHGFFRSVEQALKLLDETRETRVVAGASATTKLARRLRFHARDGLDATRALLDTYERHALDVRAAFTRIVGEVGVAPPFAVGGPR